MAGNATVSQSTDAHGGTYSASVAGKSSSNVRLSYEAIALKAGNYTIELYVKSAEEDGAVVRPGYAKVNEQGKIGNSSDYIYGDTYGELVTTEWTKIEYSFELTEETTICPIVMNHKNGAGKAALIDDFSLTTTDGGIAEGGDTPDPDAPVVLWSEPFSAGQGAFTVENKTLPDGLSSVWSWYNANYGMKASGFNSSTSTKGVSEAWLVSPVLDLSQATDPVLTFEHTGRYFGTVEDEATLAVKVDDGEWTPVAITTYFEQTSSWTFVKNTLDLKAYEGRNFQFALIYKSTEDAAGTWEVRNVAISGFGTVTTVGPEPVIEEVPSLAEVKTKEVGEYYINLENAVVTYVNGNNAYIQDATAGILVYLKNHGLVAGQCLNGKVKATLYNFSGLFELTAFDASAATVTDGADIPETVVSVAELTADPMKYESMRVKVVGVTAGGAFTDRAATVTQDGSELALYQKSTSAEFTFGEGDVIDVVGYPGMFKEDFQLNVWDSADVTAHTTDGIGSVTLPGGADSIYTIDGRRVQKLVKGLYVVNGKKVLVK